MTRWLMKGNMASIGEISAVDISLMIVGSMERDEDDSLLKGDLKFEEDMDTDCDGNKKGCFVFCDGEM